MNDDDLGAAFAEWADESLKIAVEEANFDPAQLYDWCMECCQQKQDVQAVDLGATHTHACHDCRAKLGR